MADVLKFYKGQSANLNTIETDNGQLLVTVNEGYIYIDHNGNRIKLYESVINDLSALTTKVGSETVANQIQTALADYAKEGEVVTSVAKKDDSIIIDGTSAEPTIGVAIDSTEGNALKLITNRGLRVEYAAAPTYTIEKDNAYSGDDYAAVYQLKKDGVATGDAINIPKDLVVKEGHVEGDILILVLQNGQEIEIDVGSLIEYVTSGSQESDPVFITIDPVSHKVTATLTDGSISYAKLNSTVKSSLDKADSAIQTVKAGTKNGTILVDSTEVAITGLASAAYANTADFESAGAVEEALSALSLTDTAQSGQYVSAVNQTNGVITVTRATLPSSEIEWGEF